MNWTTPSPISDHVADLEREARRLETVGDLDGAWRSLADAHILSQPWPWPHVVVHAAMFGLAWRTRSRQELAGQAFRILVAAPGSIAGRYPVGNSGRSDVSAFEPAPVPDHLASILAYEGVH